MKNLLNENLCLGADLARRERPGPDRVRPRGGVDCLRSDSRHGHSGDQHQHWPSARSGASCWSCGYLGRPLRAEGAC